MLEDIYFPFIEIYENEIETKYCGVRLCRVLHHPWAGKPEKLTKTK